jgi:hypothetical protein
MIKITGNYIRHKKRIKEMKQIFEEAGAEVEVIYKKTNHIKIVDTTLKSKNKETT